MCVGNNIPHIRAQNMPCMYIYLSSTVFLSGNTHVLLMYSLLLFTRSTKYLSFLSHYPTTHKASVVCTLFHQARIIPTTGQERRKEELRVIKALRLNGYSRGFIRCFSQRPPTHTSNQPKATIIIPYIHGVSESINRRFSIMTCVCV